MKWTLDNVEDRNREHPDTFQILPRYVREAVEPDEDVQLVFLYDEEDLPMGGERMWVTVESAQEGRYIGSLMSHPVAFIPGLEHGDPVAFGPEHIANVWVDDEAEGVASGS